MTDEHLTHLIKAALARFDALSPEDQEAELRAQRDSWVRGEMGIGLDRQEEESRRRVLESLTATERDQLLDYGLRSVAAEVLAEIEEGRQNG